MVDPVLCQADGHSYERQAILQWMDAHDTSPFTGLPLATRELLRNHTLRSMIGEACNH